MNKTVLALDFDGLICDALNECILVSWNGYYGKSLDDFSQEGLEVIPRKFRKIFQRCRNFAQHLGHFIVPFLDAQNTIISADDFNLVYESVSSDVVEEFIQKVTTYRHQIRNTKETEWLQHHSLYPGMQTFLTQMKLPVYIVTAKDGESVLKILNSVGINLDENRIFGEQKNKVEAFQQITDLEHIHNQQLYFFDDNILNVLSAQKSGYTAYWATWGYNAPEHFHIAQENSVSSITLSQFQENQF